MSDRCYCDALIESGEVCNYCVIKLLKARVEELEGMMLEIYNCGVDNSDLRRKLQKIVEA